MCRCLAVLTVLAACVHPGDRTASPETADPVIAASPLSPERDDDRLVLAWLDTVARDGTECPMSLDTARRFQTSYQADGAVEYLIQRIACLCDVSIKGAVVKYDDGCAYQPQPISYRRDDGAPPSTDEQRLVDWEHRLVADIYNHPGKPDELTRAEPLAEQVDRIRAAMAETGDPDSASWQNLTAAIERLRSDVAGKWGCLLEGDLHTVKFELANHEKYDLGGRRSIAGRKLLAESAELVKPLRRRMRACKLLETDAEYQRLEAQLEAAKQRLGDVRSLENATRDRADCNSDTDDSRACKSARSVYSLEKRMEAIERKYGVED